MTSKEASNSKTTLKTSTERTAYVSIYSSDACAFSLGAGVHLEHRQELHRSAVAPEVGHTATNTIATANHDWQPEHAHLAEEEAAASCTASAGAAVESTGFHAAAAGPRYGVDASW